MGYIGELKFSEKLWLVEYEYEERHTVESFTKHLSEWRSKVAFIDGPGNTPELLLLRRNTDDSSFANCFQGWLKVSGERAAVIHDPFDEQKSVEGPFLEEFAGNQWFQLSDVLHDAERGVKSYDGHMPLLDWVLATKKSFKPPIIPTGYTFFSALKELVVNRLQPPTYLEREIGQLLPTPMMAHSLRRRPTLYLQTKNLMLPPSTSTSHHSECCPKKKRLARR